MGIKTYQEKNRNQMDKEVTQSDTCTSEEKNPKNIRKYHIPEK